MSAPTASYGMLAEFATADALLAAARRARQAGFGRIEAYAPYPVEGLAEAVGMTGERMPLLAGLGAIVGAAGGYLLQWYSASIDYPLNVGGRPLHSWPAFIPATFELAILGAAVATVVGMLVANGLPRLRHPVFDAPDFEQATRHRFFLCVRAAPDADEAEAIRRFLSNLAPLTLCEVRS
ncbi:Quinol:cytochrome c oxidoreductase membrane protein [Cupriavidus sp. H19C3]|uniref:DUF3341 domain-containing protein n=1 Tax=Cupriavidus sp. H19C3 TaxID=3241603 RepID=UPI003BF8A0AF